MLNAICRAPNPNTNGNDHHLETVLMKRPPVPPVHRPFKLWSRPGASSPQFSGRWLPLQQPIQNEGLTLTLALHNPIPDEK